MEAYSQKDTTSLGTYLEIVRRRAWVVVVCALVVPAVAYELSSRQPATYASFADVYMSTSRTSRRACRASAAVFPGHRRRHAGESCGRAGGREPSAGDRQAPGPLARRSSRPDVDQPEHGHQHAEVHGGRPIAPTAALLATSYAKAFTIYSNRRLESEPIVRRAGRSESGHGQIGSHRTEALEALHDLRREGSAAADACRPCRRGHDSRPGGRARRADRPASEERRVTRGHARDHPGPRHRFRPGGARHPRTHSGRARGRPRRPAAPRADSAAEERDAEARRARHGRAAEACCGRGVPFVAGEPRLRAPERGRGAHDPGDERGPEGGQVDDRCQPRRGGGSLREAGRAGRPRPPAPVYRSLLPVDGRSRE